MDLIASALAFGLTVWDYVREHGREILIVVAAIYYMRLVDRLEREIKNLRGELNSLSRDVDHIRRRSLDQ